MVFGRRKQKTSDPEPERSLLPPADEVRALAAADASLDVSVEILEVDEELPAQTVLAEDTRIVGTVQTASALLLAGEIEGDINSSATVTIGVDGTIKGNVAAQNLEVTGRIDGEVRARRLCVGPTGRVHGNVIVERLIIDEGGILEGRSSMKS
jgi:cytoskeletal protein CcmA (bactofilin family)